MTVLDVPLTLTGAAQQLRSGEITSEDLTGKVLDRANQLDGRLGTYLTRFDEQAMDAAMQADVDFAKGIDRGPLQGIPIGIKDIVAAAEGLTTAQSLVQDRAWGAYRDAPVVARVRAAGAVITGKLTTMEFAMGVPDKEKPFPVPRNPWNTDTWAGGSSSGAANGVAAGLFLGAIGTDSGGSIRMPAAFCGVSGLKPTYGRVPKSGCIPLSFSLDHVGPIARSARDCGVLLAAIAGHHPSDPTAVDLGVPNYVEVLDGSLAGVRIGVDHGCYRNAAADPEAVASFEDGLSQLTELGATLCDVSVPLYQETNLATMVTIASEAFAYHRNNLLDRWDDYCTTSKSTVVMGALLSAGDFVQAQRVRRHAQRLLATVFERVDLIASPTVTVGAPLLESMLSQEGATNMLGAIHTQYWDGTGNPALAIPSGFTGEGLPLSLQLAARPFEEGLLVRAGDAYQRVTDWHLRVPPALGMLSP